METIDAGGEWWLPDAPDNKVAGWLDFDPDSGIVLRLVGELRSFFAEGERRGPGRVAMTEAALDHSGRYPRILGQIGTKAVTLEGCFRTKLSRQVFGGGLSSETIHADRMYRGVWYQPGEEACGDKIVVSLAHLVYWLRPDGLRESWLIEHPDDQPIEVPLLEVKAHDVPKIVIDRPTGTLSLVQKVGLSGDRISSRSITQDFEVHFESPDVRPWHELLEAAGDFQDVLTLAVERVACIEGMSVFHPDVAQTLPDDKVVRHQIDVFARWSDRDARSEPKELHPQDVLFHFDVVGVEGLTRLLDVASRFRTELRRVIATLRQPGMYTSDRLLNRCAALESLDKKRRQTTQSKFTTRIKNCVDHAGDPFTRVVGDVDAWVDALERRRNHVAHHLENDEDPEAGLRDLVLADSAYLLFALCFLREADAPQEVYDLLRENSQVHWLQRRIPEVLSPPSPAQPIG